MHHRTAPIVALLAAIVLTGTARAERLILASASYGKNVIAICDQKGEVLWSTKTGGPKRGHTGHHDIQLLKNGNLLFHDTWTVTKEMTLDGKVVWEYDSTTMNGNQGKRVHVHAFQRLDNGLTMIVESGVGRIIEVDKDGKIHHQVKLGNDGRANTRMARKLDNGNYLVCAERPGVVTEYNPKGEIVWEYPTNTRVFGATRLRSGNTLIATGSGNSVIEVNPAGKVVWEISKQVPNTAISLKWTTSLKERDNGNFVVGNCHAGENSPQIFEITRDKQVVWQINRYDVFGNGLACSTLLTESQSAQIRKLIAGLKK